VEGERDMKDFLENLEIGEGKVKLSAEEIKAVLAKNGEIVNTEVKKVEDNYEKQINNYKTTIEDLNTQIKNAPSTNDLEALKDKIKEFETNEAQRIADEKLAKEKSIREERTNAFFNDIKFASESAKAGVIAQFNAKDFKYDEESGKFQGASEWLEELKKNDVGAFQSEVANPRFTTNISSPTQGFEEVKKSVSLNPKFKNFN